MKIITATFEGSAPDLKSCRFSVLPEFALIGRSNVGKSSLLNMLTEKRDLAMVSNTPGKTKLINFFKINGKWMLVDLPGYGYAKVANEQRFDFNESVGTYIEKRDVLRAVFVLVDCTLPPQRLDLDFMRWLGATGRPFAIILTKTDRQSTTATRANKVLLEEALTEIFGEVPTILSCSAKTKDGRQDILGIIEQTLSKKKKKNPQPGEKPAEEAVAEEEAPEEFEEAPKDPDDLF